MKPKSNGQEEMGEKKMVDKPRPIRNGREAKGEKQKPIKHNKKTV